MSGGVGERYIEAFRWRDPDTGATGTTDRAAMVRWISSGGLAFVLDEQHRRVTVGVVREMPPYLQTYADGKWTDHLSNVPRY